MPSVGLKIRTVRPIVPVVIGLALTALACGDAKRDETVATRHDHLRVRLVSSHPALTPGEICTLGVHFEVDRGWHLYGNGRSDSGLPISVAFDLPPGLEAQRLLWPTPARLVTAGEILDQVYQGSVTLLAPVVVEPDLAAEESLPLVCRIEWLVCGTGCYPGADTLTLHLPKAGGGERPIRPADRALLAEAVEKLPRSWPEEDPSFLQRWSEERWIVQVSGARRLTFLPGPDCVPLLDPIETTRSDSDRLELGIDRRSARGQSIRGILAVDRTGPPTSYTVDVPIPDFDSYNGRTEVQQERKSE